MSHIRRRRSGRRRRRRWRRSTTACAEETGAKKRGRFRQGARRLKTCADIYAFIDYALCGCTKMLSTNLVYGTCTAFRAARSREYSSDGKKKKRVFFFAFDCHWGGDTHTSEYNGVVAQTSRCSRRAEGFPLPTSRCLQSI